MQKVQQAHDIFRQQVNRVRSRRYRTLSMAACVVAQNPELLRERRHLRIPHRIIRAERVGKDHNRRALRAFQGVVNAHVSKFSKGHRVYSFFAEIALLLAATTRSTYSSAAPRYFRGSNNRSRSAAESCPVILESPLKTARRFRFSRTARPQAACTIS